MELYEQVVEAVLDRASLGAATLAGVVGATARTETGPDQVALDRVRRERERVMARYLRDRDASALDAEMRRLDGEEAAAKLPQSADVVPADVAVAYLRELPVTWRKAAGGTGRQLTADALFDRIEVLGLQEATVHLSEHAIRHGVAAALPEEF